MLIEDAEACLETIRIYDPDLHARWGDRLRRARELRELGSRSGEVLLAAIDSIVRWPVPMIENHVARAFDEGSSIAELLEAMVHVSYYDGGAHSLNYGVTAIWNVVNRRESEGRPAPALTTPLTSADMKREAKWPSPPIFPYQSPYPRVYQSAMQRFDPELFAAEIEWNKARFKLRKGLTRRMQELLVVGVDSVIRYETPRLDHHIHAAFEVGCSVQEMVEVILAAAVEVQGATLKNIAGRGSAGAPEVVHHGLTALHRVTEELKGVGHEVRFD